MIDFNLDKDKPIKNNDIDLILQQIDILFDTTPTEVFGDEYYGTTYDKYLYQLKISNDGLKHEVLSDICSLQLFGFTPTVEVYLLMGTEQDIALIDITLKRYNETYNKTYKIV